RRHAGEEYAYVALPQVALPPAFVAGGWRETALAGCAAHADGVRSGFVVAGGGEGDAALAVVLSPRRELYVEIRDRAWTPGDRLHLWIADGTYGYQTSCVAGAARPTPVEWTIGLVDGHAARRDGRASVLPVQRAAGTDGAVRFAILVPES